MVNRVNNGNLMLMNSGYCYGFLVVIMVITGYFNGIQLQRSDYFFQGPPFFLGETING